MIDTGTQITLTRHIEVVDGRMDEVFPCPCRETHRGPYAFYDWMHHTCRHGPLWLMEEGAMCSQCGAGYWEVVKN